MSAWMSRLPRSDRSNAICCRDQIKLLHRESPPRRIYATHDPIEAMIVADRTVLMREGRGIEQEGTPLDLFERPRTRFVAGFFGQPKMISLAH